MRQGDIYWVNFPSPIGERPAIVITRTRMVPRLTGITVIPLTRVYRRLESEVVIAAKGDLASESIANLDNIQTVSKDVIGAHVGTASPDEMDEIFQAICYVFDIPF